MCNESWPTDRVYSDQPHPCTESARMSLISKRLSDKAAVTEAAVAKMYEREQYWLRVAADRLLVIGLVASALGIEDLESAYSDPAVILQAIEDLKGTP